MKRLAVLLSILVLASSLVQTRVAVGCTTAWSSSYIGETAWATLNPGASMNVVVEWQNTGCNTWDQNVAGARVYAGTWNPTPGQDNSSYLGGASVGCGTQTNWTSCNRIAPTTTTVGPGQTGWFSFNVTAPAAPGTYQVYLRLVDEGVQWLEDQGVYWQMTVPASQGFSRYEESVDARIPNQPPGTPAGSLYVQGCKTSGDEAGTYGGPYTPQAGIVVLHFGDPSFDPTQGYGAVLHVQGYEPISVILAAAKAFAQGYWDCRVGLPSIIIAIGTTNCGNGPGPDLCDPNGTNVSTAHGRAWGQLALDLQNWLVAQGFSGYLSAVGASDMETAWETPTISRNWECVPATGGGCSDGYGSVAGVPLMYEYGDAGGCPPAGTCLNGWTQGDLWYVAWGAPPGEPLPQIYNTVGTQAQQWLQIKQWGISTYGNRMDIKGALTQRDACRTNPPCDGTDNTPQAGWTQLWNVLDQPGTPDPNLVQPLPYSSDISYVQQ